MKHVSCSAAFFLCGLFFSAGVLSGFSDQRRSFFNSYGPSNSRNGAPARNVMVQAVAQAVPVVAATVGIGNMLRAGYKWLTGTQQKPKNRSYAGHECQCEDPDLCWAKRQSDDEARQLHEEFLQAQGYNLCYEDVSRVQLAWRQLGFDRLSEDAQRFLQKRFCQIEDEQRCQSFQQIVKQPVQQQEPEKKVEQSSEMPEASLDQDFVQSRFIERAGEIKQYGQNLILGNNRQQKRRDAIQEALENGFRVSYKRYKLSDDVSALFGEYGFDMAAFQECTGNAIQQQTHAEFVDVLNRGTDLFLSRHNLKKLPSTFLATSDKGLGEGWIYSLGHFSVLGRQGNKEGFFRLSHGLSDLCQKIYDVSRVTIGGFQNSYELDTEQLRDIANKCFKFIKKAFESPREICKEVLDVLSETAALLTDFSALSEGFLGAVAHKAFVRPLERLADAPSQIKNDPDIIIRKVINNLINFMAKSVYKGYILSSELENNPASRQTQKSVQEFHKGCLSPLCNGLSTIVHELETELDQEKLEELAAMVVQWITINGLGKLVHLVSQKGQLAQLASLIKLAELPVPSQDGPGFVNL